MSTTNEFFIWYFEGLSGMGGWLIFLLLAIAAVAWLIYDSQTRRIPALGWLMGAILVGLLVLPSAIWRFTSGDTRLTLDQFKETFFYVGLLGGIIPVVIAVGYFVSYRGMVGCDKGHVYEAALGNCPVCAAAAPAPPPISVVQPSPPPMAYRDPPTPRGPSAEPRPHRAPVVDAWLVDRANNRRYDLYPGSTHIGRKSDGNDHMLADPAVSKEHIQIKEAHGHFTLYDLGSKTGTLLNGRKLRAPQVLQDGDEITIGDTVLKFISSR
jgi:hypothetical protein